MGLRWLVALILLLIGLGLYFISPRDNEDFTADYQFAIDKTERIETIKIDYRLIEPDIVLTKQRNGIWAVNGQFLVRPDAMRNLLSALERMELAFIPNEKGRKTMVRDLATTGTKVEVFDKDHRRVKAFFIGGNTPDERATYVVMDGSEKAAAVTLSGFEGSIRPIFTMPLHEWRDRMFIKVKPDSVVSISVSYPDDTASSFNLVKKGSSFQMFDYLGVEMAIRDGAVESYLYDLRAIGAEAIIEDEQLVQQVTGRQPFAEIIIHIEGQFPNEYIFYAQQPSDNTKVKIQRYYAIDSRGDLFLTQHRIVKSLFRSISYFQAE